MQVQARILLPRFEMPVMVDVPDGTIHSSGKMQLTPQAGDQSRNGFSGGFWWQWADWARSPGNRSFSWRTIAVSASANATLRLTDRASKSTISRPSQ